MLHAANGAQYLGFEYNTDDHMVYAAWMRQAMDGRFLMDNRFTTDPQPGLTVHIYFFLLGCLAKLVGIPVAAALGRLVFTLVFLLLGARLIDSLQFSPRGSKIAPIFLIFGGGIGFLAWQMFGVSITKPLPDILKNLLCGQLPIDVWQPEAFVFPSMLTNGLFMVSLCLILASYEGFLGAERGWRPVATGCVALAVLMNIHSYDVLTIALVMSGFLAAALVRKRVTPIWLLRAAVIAAGAIPAALWFKHVLSLDPVFQSRAATETYSPNFRAVFFGYLPLMILGVYGAVARAQAEPDRRVRRLAGVGLMVLTIVGLAIAAGSYQGGYFLGWPAWGAVFVAAVGACALWSDEDSGWNLVFAWAAIGTIAIYFPGLYQRKLTMGLSIPWALLAAYGLDALLRRSPAGSRRLYEACAALLVCASSLLWLVRDISYINQNVANTTRHPVYLDADLVKIIAILNDKPGRKVVLALPGAGSPNADTDGHALPDSFSSPTLPDISPILSGLTGAYTYAGHWSETPDYSKRTSDMYHFFLSRPVQSVHAVMDPAERKAFIDSDCANYAVLPSGDKGLPLVSPSELGAVVYSGPIWTLIRLNG